MVASGQSSLRWACNVADWAPNPMQMKVLIDQESSQEGSRIQNFKKTEDARLALMGRVMLRASASMALQKDAREIKFGRTKGGKPFIQEAEAANRGLNSNVSHHGRWVALGMEEKGLVGVDVSRTTTPRANLKCEEFFGHMAPNLTPTEWAAVRRAGETDREKCFAFFLFWSLKEAYTKAMGMGVALPFGRIQLNIPPEMLCKKLQQNSPRVIRRSGSTSYAPKIATNCARRIEGAVTATLDGIAQDEWEFELFYLDEEHVMAVAVGPHSAAVPSWKSAMEQLSCAPSSKASTAGIIAGSNAPNDVHNVPKLQSVTNVRISDLVSGDVAEKYALAV
mmetsp:Transcript_28868/g.68411  ORF Transcript_28868/g.68411 Transcript_28868/m.68411 type:complete len:336 (+) Transcript_28868:107-1114(+)